MTPAELQRRVGRFRQVAVLRPDGCLAWALTGRAQQRIGEVKWEEGAFRAHHFELGRFYVSNGFVFRLANERLEPIDSAVFVEVYDDADPLGRALDGAESAFLKLALSVGQLLTHPLDSLAELKNLPSGVAALIAASPAYFERFRHMTRGEQIHATAELATNLLVTAGTASATTRTVTGALAGAEAHVPVLSLSAQGALRVEQLAVPIGRAATVVGGGPGAAIVLHRANSATIQPSGGPGPGQWGPVKESMSPRARRYQEQISGHSADEAYWVGGVKFDGFEHGVLLEAKGPGYAQFFDDLEPKDWFQHSGAKSLVDQANRQSQQVRSLGVLIEWHVAEARAAEAITRLLERNSIKGIRVIHSPAR
ncbi:Tox-REase-5 domain-containing protein [Myxococcus fulvus]|uniref:Tox-REase-5 domain-containing protein n=1 Tax=Myxococcus fulvus TaxID=33 RepID=UPI003B9A0DC7